MYTVMIAEDELLVRMGLSSSIPWNSLDMQVIAAESNGASAWETFGALKPDIVITDLRMPGMDGTELIRRIRETGSDCEIIVVTCLEEFEILYQLMQMHITGYLLKATMSQGDILKLLQQAKRNLDGSPHFSPESGEFNGTDDLFRNFVLVHHDPDRYRQECERKGRKQEPFGGILILQLEGDDTKLILLPTVQAMFLDKLSSFGIQNSFLNENQAVYVLPENTDALPSDLNASLLELARYSSDILGARLRMALLLPGSGGADCDLFWKKGQKVLQDNFFYPDTLTVWRDGTSSAQKKLLKGIDDFQRQITIVPWRVPGKKEAFFVRLQDLRSSFENRAAFLQVAVELTELYRSSFFGENLPDQTEIQDALAKVQSAQSALEYFSKLLLPAVGGHSVYGEKILETMRYIRGHAEESISLSSLANMVALSPNYYASLFKQMAGCSFSEYIGDVRMEKACTLLNTTELSVMEIAQRCGYSDMTYFIRFFKQKMGKPPRRWRRED